MGMLYNTSIPEASQYTLLLIPYGIVGVASNAQQQASQGSSRQHKRLAAVGACSTRVTTHFAVAGEGHSNNGCAIVASRQSHKVSALIGLVLVHCFVEITVQARWPHT